MFRYVQRSRRPAPFAASTDEERAREEGSAKKEEVRKRESRRKREELEFSGRPLALCALTTAAECPDDTATHSMTRECRRLPCFNCARFLIRGDWSSAYTHFVDMETQVSSCTSSLNAIISHLLSTVAAAFELLHPPLLHVTLWDHDDAHTSVAYFEPIWFPVLRHSRRIEQIAERHTHAYF